MTSSPKGELERVGQLLVSRLDRSPAIDLDSVSAELKHYVQYVTSFPVSRVRGFEILCRRKDGTPSRQWFIFPQCASPKGR